MRKLLLAPHGSPARLALAGLVAQAQAADPLAPVTVAVASTYAALSLRRGEAGVGPGGGAGLVNVRFMSLQRVAELIGAPFLAAPGRVPLTPEAEREAVRRALVEEPGVFAPVAHHPATVRAVAETLADLRPAGAEAVARLGRGDLRSRSLAQLHTRVQAHLHSTYDDEEQLVAAATEVQEHGVPNDIGVLVVHLPLTLSPGGVELIRVFAAQERAAAVVGITGDPDADTAIEPLLARLVPVLGPAQPSVAKPSAKARVVVAPDPDTEVRTVVQALAARADAGHPLHGVAVTYRVAHPYAALVHERCAEARIPVHGPSVRRLSDSVAGRTLTHLLRLRAHDLRRDHLVALGATASILDPTHGGFMPAARWDRVARQAGVIGGLEQWQSRLAHRRRELEERADPEHLAERIAEIDGLERFVEEIAEALGLGGTPADSWEGWATWARGLLDQYLGRAPQSWPEEEARALEALHERLAALGTLPSDGPPVSELDFTDAIDEELHAGRGHVGRFGEGVLVAPIGALAGVELHTVFVVGMVEGGFAIPGREDPLLSDADRVAAGIEPRRAGTRARERATYLAAIGGAEEVVLSFPRGDPDAQRALLPVAWLVEATRALGNPTLTASQLAQASAENELAGVRVIDSFAASLEQAPHVSSRRDWGLRALTRVAGDVRALHEHPMVFDAPGLKRGLDLVAARASAHFTAYDGVIGERAGLMPDAERPLSPSRIEAWAQCPFRYFLANVLRLRAVDPPETRDTIESRVRGSLLHDVLEKFFAGHLLRAPDQGWTPADRARLRELAEAAFSDAELSGVTGRPLLWSLEQRRILRELNHTLTADESTRKARQETPIAVEKGFGRPDDEREEWPPLTVDLDGRAVTFHGRIDRVDESIGGGEPTLTVYDYKTGGNDDAKALANDPVGFGRQLQLAVYAHAAKQQYPTHTVRAAYWHTRQPLGKELTPIDLDDNARARFRQVLGQVTDGVTAGVFPANPGKENAFYRTWENCRFCDFKNLCPAERHRTWERKIDDPVIKPYRALEDADPDAEHTT